MLAFIADWLISYYVLAAFIIFGLFCEKDDGEVSTVICTVVCIAVSYLLLKPDFLIYWFAGIYFVIGVIWSLWRYYRHVLDNYTPNAINMDPSGASSYHNTQLKPENTIGRIVTWILCWPFSFVNSCSGDCVDFVKYAIRNWLHGIYSSLMNSAIKQAEKNVKK